MAEALHIAESLARDGELDEAAAVIRKECREAAPSELAAVRHLVIEGYIRKDRCEAACCFALEEIKERTSAEGLRSESLELLLHALHQGQLYSRAVELLQSMCQPGVRAPSDQVFNSMLDATVRTRSWSEAWEVLDLLLKCGRKADKYFVSILTKSLESSNDRRWVRRGISLVEKFIEQQREDVDEIVFNSLLNVLGQNGDMAKLQQTLNKMNEYAVAPSAVTYGTVVKAYGRARDTESVLRVWNQMRNRCLGINPVTCGCVLDACVKCNSLDKAMAIFEEMRLQGMHKNTVLYATLIKGLAKIRDLPTAMQLYRDMRVEGVPCNLVTFNSLMDVCVRCGDLQTAAVFLQDMMQMQIEPDLITFSTLIKGYSRIGEVHKALALSRELKARGLKCDEIMYNGLIDGCAKARRLQDGLDVFEDMLRSRVQPSHITFSILVKLYFEAGQVEEAFRLVEEMQPKYRCLHWRTVYTALLRCTCQTGRPALAHAAQLLTDLASSKNSKLPDQVMVSSLLTACVQHGDLESMARLVREFATGSRRNCAVGLDNLKHCFEALGGANEALGHELLEYLRERSFPSGHVAMLEASLAAGKDHPGWSQVRTGSHQASDQLQGSGMTAQYSGQHYAVSEMQQFPVPMYSDMYSWDQSMTMYAAAGEHPFYAPQHDAAAACAALTAYHQHMARYAAAAAAAAYPECAIMPPFLPSLGAEAPARTAATGALTYYYCEVPQVSPAIEPMPAADPAVHKGIAQEGKQDVATKPSASPAKAMPAALSPLPAGPVSPSSAREVSETPGAMLSEKAVAGKENARKIKDKAYWKAKGRQNKENIHGLRERQQVHGHCDA
mmetsp:Transcript_92090/g.219328  ORF Transcript_92090/g.219328 Transcript_92090/m.219328 type:complete len:839 (+) Transcript_92090:35-2551(+)